MNPWLLVFLLAVALGWCFWRLHHQTQIVRGLARALERGHGFLRETEKGWYGNRHWKSLIRAVNRLLEEKKLLEADRAGHVERMKATLANMQEAVLIVDDEDSILLVNDAFRDLFPAQARTAEETAWIFRNSVLIEHLQAVRAGQPQGRREIEFSCDGASLWVEVSGSRISTLGDETEEATLLVLHDITRLRRLESVRKEFVANVSHELRTPLSLIKGYIETLTDGGSEMPEEDRRRFLQIIEKHTTRLERLVEDLLALSRLESGNPRLRSEELLLERLMEEIVDTYRSGEKTATCTFLLDLDPNPAPVWADPLRIAQVMGNLLENAAKYSGDNVIIEAGTRREGDVVKAWVRDNGVGISEKDLPHIFERFYRVDKGRSRESGGTGLGLSIVKHIVQLHGGHVWAESGQPKGTRISFTLPLAGREGAGEARQAPATP